MSNLPAAPAPDQVQFVAPDDGVRIDVRIDNETVWLAQAQIAELFGRTQPMISKHVRNVFSEGELDRGSNIQKVNIASSTTTPSSRSLSWSRRSKPAERDLMVRLVLGLLEDSNAAGERGPSESS